MDRFAFLIPGFLGLPTDWDSAIPAGINAVKVDLFSKNSKTNFGNFTLPSIARSINRMAQKLSPKVNSGADRLLVGYSLGGRIALHALLADPKLWSGAVIISANPGLSDPQEKAQRMEKDRRWAERFAEEDWNSVITDWNAQDVFQDVFQTEHLRSLTPKRPERYEAWYCRRRLRDAMILCSLGLQEDLRQALKKIKKPIVWVVGEHDLKFKAIAEEMATLNSAIKVIVAPHAGHRVIFDQPQIIHDLLYFNSPNFFL